MKSNGTLNMED
uniref:Uncharacterized protein n=1 Tax=Zea mays TaxID=4577 RepID=C4J1L3_MAIZE|nr:unknown [Zea mays]